MASSEWDEYVKWLGTPNKALNGFPVCPYIKRRKWQFVERDTDTVVVVLDGEYTPDGLNEIVRGMQLSLRALGLEATPIHPDYPFSVDGVHTRRAPAAALTIVRRRVVERLGGDGKLGKTNYYDKWPADWQESFPGTEYDTDS
jgi:hypothetical protein